MAEEENRQLGGHGVFDLEERVISTDGPTEIPATNIDPMLPSGCGMSTAPLRQSIRTTAEQGESAASQKTYAELLEDALAGHLTEADDDEFWKRFVFDGCSSEPEQATHHGEVATTRPSLERSQPSCDPASAQPPPDGDADIAACNNLPPQGQEDLVCSPGEASRIIPEDYPIEDKSRPDDQGGSSGNPEQQQDFKFSQPRLFIGRLTSRANVTQTSLGPPPKRGQGGASRKRDAQRPNIRGLPDFDGDPIEDE